MMGRDTLAKAQAATHSHPVAAWQSRVYRQASA